VAAAGLPQHLLSKIETISAETQRLCVSAVIERP